VAMSADMRTMSNSPGAVGAVMSTTGVLGGVARYSPVTAIRSELRTVAALLAAAGLAWWFTADEMAGMDAGPGTALGSVGWFTGVWTTMMAAMMLPSLAPTAAVFAASVRRELSRVLLFAGGYLLVWSVAGIGAYGLLELGKSLFAGSLAWHSGGRWLAAGVLALAALYQLTPLKRTLLLRCRSPLQFLDTSWQQTRPGALVTVCATADGVSDVRGP
jgi:Predicted metal-binding integral membrane protein (DUF2182)